MADDRWERIERLYHSALERPEAERASFLAGACGGDEALRREVESLLGEHPSAFLNDFGNALVADLLRSDSVPALAAPLASGDVRPSRAAKLPYWAQIVIIVAAVRTAAGLILYLGSDHSGWLTRQLPYSVYAAFSCALTVLGVALVVANRRDLRAAWLGGVFILLGAPMANPLLLDARWLLFVRPEAFNAAFFWYFLALFPHNLDSRAGRIVRGVAAAAAIVGLVFFAGNLSALALGVRSALFMLTRADAEGFFWPVTFLMSAAAFPVLVWRAIAAHGEARRRVRMFAGGLLLGIAPVSIEVLLEELWPAYRMFVHTPDVEPIVGSIIFGALAIVPFVTAYSVLYDHVVEMRVVLRAAIQYALARYTIIAATLVPFAALAVFLFTRREEPIIALMGGPRPLMLTACAGAGLIALRLRSTWLDALDRRYFREAYDAREILSRVVGDSPPRSDAELAGRLHEELSQALHADVDIFLVDETRTALRHVDGRLPSLSLKATLADLALADSRPMDVDLSDASSPLFRLARDEQDWLRRGGFSLLVALGRSTGGAAGLLALTPKQSGLQYSVEDRRLLSTVASTASLALDSLRLRSTPESASGRAARQCLDCSRLSPPDAVRCGCGGHLVDAAVPHMLRGVFRIEEKIGAGGMGVVYRAVDINLRREVAIKGLPHVTPAHVARLRREARAMAAVMHPNLAVIHGIEMWQDTPFLVQEYLAGGTLAKRLAASPLPIPDVLNLGITLADVLQQLHGSGIIHCDIKPSNIGFTQHGVVKLLDFGLARVLRDARLTTAQSSTMASAQAFIERPGDVFGTPQYMSPEAVRGEQPTPLVDLWALGVVLFESITGRYPFSGPDVAAIFACIVNGRPAEVRDARPDAPPGFSAFFQQVFARNPGDRPPDAAALASALRHLLREIA
jgi:hypothetical protein